MQRLPSCLGISNYLDHRSLNHHPDLGITPSSIWGSIDRFRFPNALGVSLKIGPGCAIARQYIEMTIILQISSALDVQAHDEHWGTHTPSRPTNKPSLWIRGPLYPSLNSSIRYAHRIKMSRMANAKNEQKTLNCVDSLLTAPCEPLT